MTPWLYNIGIFLFDFLLNFKGFFDQSIRNWNLIRRNQSLNKITSDQKPHCWIHCASLGEYEQVEPIAEKLRTYFPNIRYTLTFFSPSGYLYKAVNSFADNVFYLPLDDRSIMNEFITKLKPDMFIAVKYELWYNMLSLLIEKDIPVFYTNVTLRKGRWVPRMMSRIINPLIEHFSLVTICDRQTITNLAEMYQIVPLILVPDTRIDNVLQRKEDEKKGR